MNVNTGRSADLLKTSTDTIEPEEFERLYGLFGIRHSKAKHPPRIKPSHIPEHPHRYRLEMLTKAGVAHSYGIGLTLVNRGERDRDYEALALMVTEGLLRMGCTWLRSEKMYVKDGSIIKSGDVMEPGYYMDAMGTREVIPGEDYTLVDAYYLTERGQCMLYALEERLTA